MKQRLRTAAICLVLGAITTVAVAWASAAWVRVQQINEYAQGRTDHSPAFWFIRAYREPGVQYIAAFSVKEDETDRGGPELFDDYLQPAEMDWPDAFRDAPDLTASHNRRVLNLRGWPWPALWCEVQTNFSPVNPIVSGGVGWKIEQPSVGFNSGVDGDYATLPFRILWYGFVVDTTIFALVWAVLLAVHQRLRKRLPYLTRWSVVCVSVMCIASGALTTFGVAWLCAVHVDERYEMFSVNDGFGASTDGINYSHWHVFREWEPGAMRVVSQWYGRDKGYSLIGGGPDGPVEDYLPYWTDYLTPTDDDMVLRVLDARGWPMLAMWGGFEVSQQLEGNAFVGSLGATKHAILLRSLNGVGPSPEEVVRILPLAPIWPGFAVDTLFYATVWMVFLLLLRGPSVIPRTIRHRRGQCPACAYPVGESPVCTECGGPLD